MAVFFDDDQSLNSDRAEALKRRTLFVGALAALASLIALFVSVRMLARLWDAVQGMAGRDVPALHVPASLQGPASGVAFSWLALVLLSVGVYGLTTGHFRRLYAWLALGMVLLVAIADITNASPLRDPLFFVPSRLERELMRGHHERARKIVDDEIGRSMTVDAMYLKAQLALRQDDRVGVAGLIAEMQPQIDRYLYSVSKDPPERQVLSQAYGHLRPRVFHAFDRLLYGRAVGAPALEYARRHGLDKGWSDRTRTAVGIAIAATMAMLALALLWMWRAMRANYLAVMDHL